MIGASALELETRLGRLIDTTGPIPLALYMAECNAHYYASGDPLGRGGDFITAPEISQMFGEMVGLWCADIWLRQGRPGQLAYVELGPGRGTLAADALRTMAQFGFEPPAYLIDSSPVLQNMQSSRVPQASLLPALDQLRHDGPMLIIANEFFDALPVRQMVATHSGWREKVVARNQGKFMAMPGIIPVDSAVPPQFQRQPPGTIMEVSPARDAVMQDAAQQIADQGGAMLVVDYGYSGPKTGETFQAVHNHEFADPFAAPGQADLTAHVDFTTLIEAARAAGVRAYGPVGQGDWLRTLGIEARADALAAQNPKQMATIEIAKARLTGADQMGRLFQVMAAGHPQWPKPEGFA